jgi:hypothetical protein
MMPDDYLIQLQKELKNFPDEERADLLAEIASHFEAGADDEALGPDAAARQARLAQEMGAPQDLGRGLRGVHRPNGWLDYLLVVAPAFVLFPILGNLFFPADVPSPSAEWLGIRAVIVLSALVLLAGVWRRSVPLQLYWISITLADIISLMTREQRWALFSNRAAGSPLESIFWYAGLAALAYWMAALVRKRGWDLLLLTFAAQPLLLAGANYATVLIAMRANLNFNYPNWAVGPLSLFKAVELVWPALFFIARNRQVRWLGVALSALNVAVLNTVAGWRSPLVVAVWVLFTGVAALGWWLDRPDRRMLKA